jgi:hypothetical protein
VSWEDRCELNIPRINWRAPEVKSVGDGAVFVCRFCLLRSGFAYDCVNAYPSTKDEFMEHMRIVHGRTADIQPDCVDVKGEEIGKG